MGRKWLILLAVLVLFARLFAAYSNPGFSSPEAYVHARHIDYILATGKPMTHDTLSWSGKDVAGSVLYEYLLAAGAFFLGTYHALKIIPNLFATAGLIIVYFLGLAITKKETIALAGAAFAGFMPYFFLHTVNNASAASLGVPLFLFLAYALLRAHDHRWVVIYLAILFFTSFYSPMILLFVFALAVYLALVLTGNLAADRIELELVFFSIFFSIWAQFIVYKNVLFFHGWGIFFQHIPDAFLANLSHVSLLGIFYDMGVVPLIAGIAVVYHYFLKKKDRTVYLLTGVLLAITLTVWLRLAPLVDGILYMSQVFSSLFAEWLRSFQKWFTHTRAARYPYLFTTSLTLLFLLTTIHPIVAGLPELSGPRQEYLEAMDFLKTTPQDSIVAAPLDDGIYIASIAQRANVLDSDILLAPSPEERLSDIKRLVSTHIETEAVELMDKYHAEYLLIHDDQTPLAYAPGKCFTNAFSNTLVTVYHKSTLCRVRPR